MQLVSNLAGGHAFNAGEILVACGRGASGTLGLVGIIGARNRGLTLALGGLQGGVAVIKLLAQTFIFCCQVIKGLLIVLATNQCCGGDKGE